MSRLSFTIKHFPLKSIFVSLASYPRDIPLHLPLAGGEETVSCHGISALHCLDNGDVGEEHDQHRDEKAKD